MGEFRMPSLGADMTEGTVLEWHVAPGDLVHRGDIVATVDTSKAEIDVEVFEDGVIDELRAEPGTVVPVGGVLATLHPAGGVAESAVAAGGRPSAPPVVAAPAPAAVPSVAEAIRSTGPNGGSPMPDRGYPFAPAPLDREGRRRRATPVARRMAAALGVDLTGLTATGPHGAIRKADVERAAHQPASPPRAPARAPVTPSAPMRDAIAKLMARSQREVPAYHLATDIDLSRALAWLADRNAERPLTKRLVPAALLLAATARAAREVPELNGLWVDGALQQSDGVHLGVAISLRGGGLVAPAIHDADRKDPDQLMAALRDLVRRARSGGLRGSEMADPTLTVTNLGDLGVSTVFGVVYPPQVAIVGFGNVRDRPWAQDGMLGVRPVVTATLSADHRASDGAVGARLLQAIDRLLQAPEDL